MIILTVIAKVKPEKIQEFVQTMRFLNDDSEKEKGLRRSTLYQDVVEKSRFSLIYEWEAHEDLQRYSDSENFKVLLGALRVLCERSEMNCSHVLVGLNPIRGNLLT